MQSSRQDDVLTKYYFYNCLMEVVQEQKNIQTNIQCESIILWLVAVLMLQSPLLIVILSIVLYQIYTSFTAIHMRNLEELLSMRKEDSLFDIIFNLIKATHLKSNRRMLVDSSFEPQRDCDKQLCKEVLQAYHPIC
jgi:hypothetical protein